jgi:hypothetical protein
MLRFTRPVLMARLEWLASHAQQASGHDLAILDARCLMAVRYWLRAIKGTL